MGEKIRNFLLVLSFSSTITTDFFQTHQSITIFVKKIKRQLLFTTQAFFLIFHSLNLTDSKEKKYEALDKLGRLSLKKVAPVKNQGNQGEKKLFCYSINVKMRRLIYLSYLHKLLQRDIWHNLAYPTKLLYSSFK